jgi:hypothetical protein
LPRWPSWRWALPLAARRLNQRAGALLYALVLVPPFVVFALSRPNPVLYAPNLSVRYLLIFLPAYHLLLGAAVVWLWGLGRRPDCPTPFPAREGGDRASSPTRVLRTIRGARPLGALAVVFLVGASVWSLADHYPGRRLVDDYQTVTRYLAAHARPGDAVVLSSDRDWPIYLYYFAGDLPRYGVSMLRPVTPEGAAALLAPLLGRHGSLWLLTSDNAYDSDPAGHVPAWLRERARLVGEVAGPYRRLALYSTDPTRGVESPAAVRPERRAEAAFEGGVGLLGYDLPSAEIAPGEQLRLAVYWQADGPLPADARASLRFVGQDGLLYRDAEMPLHASLPPDRWRPGQPVRSDYVLAVPRATPPGRYALALGVAAGGRDLPAIDGGTGAPWVVLRNVRVVGPGVEAPARPTPRHVLDVRLGERIGLIGYDLTLAPERPGSGGTPPRARLAPGDVVRLRLYWEALQAIDRPYTVFVQLVGPATNPATGNPVWGQRDTYPAAGQRPTDGWAPGEVVADDYELAVPPNAPAGAYRVIAGMYDLASGRRLPVSARGQSAGDSVLLLEGELTP